MTQALTLISADTETFLISQENLAPRIVCLSLAASETDTDLIANHTWDKLHDTIKSLLENKSIKLVGQSIGYDLSVFCSNFPDLLPLVFQALEDERISDVGIREKLLVLATTGDLAYTVNPDGSKSKSEYNLAAIIKNRLGKDVSASKKGDDSYRLHYDQLDNMPLEQWPQGAKDYPIQDVVDPLHIHKLQSEENERLISQRGVNALKTESFRVYVDFCLRLMSAWGAKTDPAMVALVEDGIAKELTPDRLNLIAEKGILRPAEPPQPFANGAQNHVEGCPKKGCGCPVKMTAGKDESINKTVLQEFIKALSEKNSDVVLMMTDKSTRFPEGQISTAAEWMDEFAHLDPVLEQYQHRQSLQKLVTTEIPRMKLNNVTAAVVHPQYDCLKETGRTSSFSSKSKDYASFNIQNVDPRVRKCFVARPGYLLFSIDYSQMELGTLAQTCFDLFGHSTLKDKINTGVDVHAYTGAQLAAAMDPEFKRKINDLRFTQAGQIADVFFGLKKNYAEGTAEFKFYNHWRKFAKPTNLGYPGGLGPKTFIKYAKATYDVIVDLEMATQFRELWRETYPEMKEYFNYINTQCVDKYNKGWDAEKNKEITKYCYTSPFGMHRAGCDYCACANGIGLQTPSAEGVLLALIKIIPLCYDWTRGSILGPDKDGATVRPFGLIHDEFIGEIREDDYAHERMMEMNRLMVEAMLAITPDVKPSATPVLMRRWDKEAQPVYDEKKRLTVWQPKG